MKKKIDSPFRKLRMLLVLPLVAMVFYAFAKPEYVTPTNAFPTDNVTANADGNDVKGKVVNLDGKPLHGTSVIVAGTTIGTIADIDGNFKLNSVPKDAKIAFSFVGFKTVMQKPDFDQPMTIKMVTDTVKFEEGVVAVGYSPLPALASKEGKDLNSLDNPPLYIVDGKIIDKVKFDKFNTADFESIDVLKDKSATDKYGEKGKYGVLEITMKKPHSGTTPGPIVDLKSIDSKNPPLYVVDGVITDKRRAEYFLDVGVESVSELKGKTATEKYGEKGKYGVLEITLKKVPAVSLEKKSVDVNAKSDVAVNSKSQRTKESIFVVVEEMPVFPGGDQACKEFIARTLKYPIKAMNSGKTGKVFLTFIVNKYGKVENAQVVRGIDPALDAEAIRVINSLPEWKPGKQRGVAVNVVYAMPIEFMLQ